MKFMLMTLLLCLIVIVAVSAKPIEEAIPDGIEGAAGEVIGPNDDQPILLKLKLLKKLLFIG